MLVAVPVVDPGNCQFKSLPSENSRVYRRYPTTLTQGTATTEAGFILIQTVEIFPMGSSSISKEVYNVSRNPIMNGFGTAARLRNLGTVCPIIAVASDTIGAEQFDTLEQAGFTKSVKKPVGKHYMRTLLELYELIPPRVERKEHTAALGDRLLMQHWVFLHPRRLGLMRQSMSEASWTLCRQTNPENYGRYRIFQPSEVYRAQHQKHQRMVKRWYQLIYGIPFCHWATMPGQPPPTFTTNTNVREDEDLSKNLTKMLLTESELRTHVILDKPVNPNRNIAQIYLYVSNLPGFERVWFFTNFNIVFFDSEENASSAMARCRSEGKFKARPDRWSKEQPQTEWIPYNSDPTSTLFIVRRTYVTLGSLAMLFADMQGFVGVDESVRGFYIKFLNDESAQKAFGLVSKVTNLAPYFHRQIKTINHAVPPQQGLPTTLYLPEITEARSMEQILIYFMSFPGFRKVSFENHPDRNTPHAFIHFFDTQTAQVAEQFSKSRNNIDCTLIKTRHVLQTPEAGSQKSARLRIVLPRDFIMTEKVAVRFFTMFRGVELLHGNGLTFRTEQDAEAAAASLNLLTNFYAEFIADNSKDLAAQILVPRYRVPTSAVLCVWNYPSKHIIIYTLAKQTGLQDFTEITRSGKSTVYVLFTQPENRDAAVEYFDSQARMGMAVPFRYDPDCDVPAEAATRLGVEIVDSPLSSTNSSRSSNESLHRVPSRNYGTTSSETTLSSSAEFQRRPSNYDGRLSSSSSPPEPSKTLWIGNVPVDMIKERLQSMFAKFGRIEYTRLNPPNASGFAAAFIKFVYLADAIEAKMKMHNVSADGTAAGTPLKVCFARPPSADSSSGPDWRNTQLHRTKSLNSGSTPSGFGFSHSGNNFGGSDVTLGSRMVESNSVITPPITPNDDRNTEAVAFASEDAGKENVSFSTSASRVSYPQRSRSRSDNYNHSNHNYNSDNRPKNDRPHTIQTNLTYSTPPSTSGTALSTVSGLPLSASPNNAMNTPGSVPMCADLGIPAH
ncbi:hypothetical protein SeMB42_g02741 [Synchytrium endobioticum]|uniref:RRM domain-containing protein n=1 Tax=Synchytrium endobioticum TaxID=286115 RepID=A0A507DBY7_9FUNG|nr:hypothetical protein SeMB42_g02741 [Synchytrium endobioticum]